MTWRVLFFVLLFGGILCALVAMGAPEPYETRLLQTTAALWTVMLFAAVLAL